PLDKLIHRQRQSGQHLCGCCHKTRCGFGPNKSLPDTLGTARSSCTNRNRPTETFSTAGTLDESRQFPRAPLDHWLKSPDCILVPRFSCPSPPPPRKRREGEIRRRSSLATHQLGPAPHVVHHPGRQQQVVWIALHFTDVKGRGRNHVTQVFWTDLYHQVRSIHLAPEFCLHDVSFEVA